MYSSDPLAMGLFYVWIKHVYSNGFDQRLVIFCNREAADEWWRNISTPPSPYAGHIKRLSPQLYVHNYPKDIYYHYRHNTQSSDTAQVFEKMLFTLFSDGHERNTTMIIPPDGCTDHISGRWCFIRSGTDPLSYWYLRTSGTCIICGDANCDAIHVSNENRTRFCIRVRNDIQVPEDFVMIGKDEVSIMAPKGYILYINDAGDLKAAKGYQGETDLRFGDLKDRFITRAERQVNGEVWECVESVERGVGEPWELTK